MKATIIPFVRPEPRPLFMLVSHVGTQATVITRKWSENPEGECRRCPAGECGVRDGVCQVATPRFVPLDECGNYRIERERKVAMA